jgi:hypothetical protein
MDWHIAGDVTYSTRQYLSPLNSAPLVRAPVAVANAELGITDKERGLSATVWVKNIADKRYLEDAIDVSSFGDYALFYNPRGRSVSHFPTSTEPVVLAGSEFSTSVYRGARRRASRSLRHRRHAVAYTGDEHATAFHRAGG